MKTLSKIIAKATVNLSAFLVMIAVATMDQPCAWFWGQPKMPEALQKRIHKVH